MPLVLLMALLVGCGVEFIEPHPPQVALVDRGVHAPLVDEPVVYEVLLDLSISDEEGCQAVQEHISRDARRHFLPPGRVGQELPVVDLSPGCRPRPERRLALDTLDERLNAVRAAFAGHEVRPLYLYVNNVSLPLPAGLQSDMVELELRAIRRGDPAPLLWALGTSGVFSGLFHRSAEWTYGQDPALMDAIGGFAQEDLPLVSRAARSEEYTSVFSEEELTQVRQWRVCWADPRLESENLPGQGHVVPLDPTHPPRIRYAVSPLRAEPRAQYSPEQLPLLLEACSASCDRYLKAPGDEHWVRWTDSVGCLSTIPAEGE